MQKNIQNNIQKTIKNNSVYKLLVGLGLKEKINDIDGKLKSVYPAEIYTSIEYIWWKILFQNSLLGIAASIFILITCVLVSSNNVPYILMLVTVICFGIPYHYINGLKKMVKKRNEQLIMDYPDSINRFILLLGTGINMKGAWERICHDYITKKKRGGGIHYVYEEMQYSLNEMSNGIPEAEVYERFGRRIKLLPYMKLSAMLGQNLKKGNKRMIEQLRLTSLDALAHRRETMKQLGEEASSKLLFPMMLQFILILIIIMYPAVKTL